MSVEPYTTEVTLDVEVEVLTATPAEPGRYSDRPERTSPDEPPDVEITVRLCRNDRRLDVTDVLPRALLEELVCDALERLLDAAAEAP